jgi:hypothetical protein
MFMSDASGLEDISSLKHFAGDEEGACRRSGASFTGALNHA